jgi:Asp-tRNA(Asn)/Glu-tRNA(Gln) amidotransferase A subunit family amidase
MTSYIDLVSPTFRWSLPGLPVVPAPAGIVANGLPVGLQIVTQAWLSPSLE